MQEDFFILSRVIKFKKQETLMLQEAVDPDLFYLMDPFKNLMLYIIRTDPAARHDLVGNQIENTKKVARIRLIFSQTTS